MAHRGLSLHLAVRGCVIWNRSVRREKVNRSWEVVREIFLGKGTARSTSVSNTTAAEVEKKTLRQTSF
jgi:hypothetical protein